MDFRLARLSFVLLLWPVAVHAQVIVTSPTVSSVTDDRPLKGYASQEVRDAMLGGPEATCDFYAAPNATPSGNGSQAQPWALQTALNQPAPLAPGRTLCLRGGTYTGLFVSNLNGIAGNKTTVRSAPGEWAVIDGYVRSTLTQAITASATTIPVVDGSSFSSDIALDVTIGTDGFKIYGRTGNTLNVYFGLSTGHPQGAEIVVSRGAALTINGSHVIFRDFEIKSSDPVRTDSTYRWRVAGVDVRAPESLVLNLVIHDTSQGLGFWEQARNAVACGNLLYNNGVQGKGHGIYTQNEGGTKLLCDNITFGNFGLGMQMYTTNGGPQVGFTWDGNVNFNNRYLFGGQQPMDELTVTNNFLYGASIELGYGGSGPHGSAVVRGNYVYANFPFITENWNSVAVTQNKFYMMPSFDAVMRVNLPVNGSIANYTFANNDYLFTRSWNDKPFHLKAGFAQAVEYQIAQWRIATGDTTSTYLGATQQSPSIPSPTGLDVFYRANPYEAGRGHVIIYNYDGNASVSLDLSRVGLTIGQPYQIRNGQNYLAPAISAGTYSGEPISVSLSGLTVAQPLTNNGEHNVNTCPAFCVLVVVPQKQTQGTSPGSPPLSPAPNEATSPILARTAGRSPASDDDCDDRLDGNTCGRATNPNGDGDVFTYNPTTGAWSRQITLANGAVSTTAGSWSPGWTVKPAQFNADALTDYFLFNPESGQWAKMINTGAGFTSQASGGWRPGWRRHVMDLDGDGISDLFLYDADTGQWFKAISTPTGFSYVQGAWNPGWEIHPMTLNDDAMGDLFLINRSTGRWFWALGQAGAGFSYPVNDAWSTEFTLHPGDFNGDERTDLLLHDPQTGTFFVATAGASGFTYQQGGWSLGWTPVVADLNADGRDDLFLHAQASGQWLQLTSNGNGTFTNAGSQTWSLGWEVVPTDLNNDGRADFVLYDNTSGLWYQARNLTLGSFTYVNGTWAAGLTVVAPPARVPAARTAIR